MNVKQGSDASELLDAALERARNESKAIFIAINMDGEGANDVTAERVYKDRSIVKASESTVNLIALA